MCPKSTIRAAAILGFLGVALGAFGAHGLEDKLVENDRVATWDTAVLYHLIHAVALLAVGLLARPPLVVVYGFVIGVVIFSGTLYVLSLTNMTELGMITPLGGVAFLVGWAVLVAKAGSARAAGEAPER